MGTDDFCFSTSILPSAFSARSTRVSCTRRTVPVCVLQDSRKSATPLTVPSERAPVPKSLPPDVPPANYRVLPEDMPESEKPPLPPTHYTVPVFGYVLDTMFGISSQRETARRYGGVYTSDGLAQRMHFVTDYNAINQMVKDTSVFKCKDSSEVLKRLFTEDSMLLLDGVEHQTVRTLMATAFSTKLLPHYFERFVQPLVSQALSRMAARTAAGEPALLEPMARECLLAVIIAMVNNISMDSEYYSEVRELHGKLFNAAFVPPWTPIFAESMRAREKLLDIVDKLMRRALVEDVELIEDLRKHGDDVLQQGSRGLGQGSLSIMHVILADSKVQTGADAVHDERLLQYLASLLMGLWFAGSSTTAATLTCALFELGFRREVWEALAAEQEALIEEAGTRQLAFEQLNQMPLLESFFQETLRLYPAARGSARKVARDCEVFGRRLEAGSLVLFDFIAASNDERYFEDPSTFKFDRFLKRDGVAPPPKPQAFGAIGSAHYCIGAMLARVEFKTMISTLLREYKSMEMQPNQSRDYKYLPDTTPKSKGIVTRLVSRD